MTPVLVLLTSNEKYLQEFLDNLARPDRIEAQFTYRQKNFSDDAWKHLQTSPTCKALIVFVDVPPRTDTPPPAGSCQFIPVRWVDDLGFDAEFGPSKVKAGQAGLVGKLGALHHPSSEILKKLSDGLYTHWLDSKQVQLLSLEEPSSDDDEDVTRRSAWRELATMLDTTRLLHSALMFHVEPMREDTKHPQSHSAARSVPVYKDQGFALKAARTYELSLLSYIAEGNESASISISPANPGLIISQPFHRVVGQHKRESILVETGRMWDRRVTTLVLGRSLAREAANTPRPRMGHIGLVVEIAAHPPYSMILGVLVGAALVAVGSVVKQPALKPILTGLGTAVTGLAMWFNTRSAK